MEHDIIDSLEDIGVKGEFEKDDKLRSVCGNSEQLPEYSQLVSLLCNELGGLLRIEDRVNAIASSTEVENFLLELSGFLRECGCPYTVLTGGEVNQRLRSAETKLLLVDYLCTEVQAARMLCCNKPDALISVSAAETKPELAESDVAAAMRKMLMALSFTKPPPNITPFLLFSKVEDRLKERMQQVSQDHISKPILKACLSDKQWTSVMMINDELSKEYQCRRDMILKRLDVTIQSFMWSDLAKRKEDQIFSVYRPLRDPLNSRTYVSVASILAAREDLLNVDKVTGKGVQEHLSCPVKSFMTGKMPDRGGRAHELEPPPPEMPSWKQRDQGHGGGRGGGRGDYHGGQRGGGDRGGRGRQGSAGQTGGGGWHRDQTAQPYGQQQGAFQQAFQGGGGGYHQQHGGGYHQQQQQQQQYHHQQQSGGSYQQYGAYSQSSQGYFQNQGGYQGHNQGGYYQDSSPQYQGGYQSHQRGGGGRGGRGRGRGRGAERSY